MNPRTLGSSILLTVAVAVTVLLIGAFAHFDSSRGEGSDSQSNSSTPVLSAAPASVPSPAPLATPSTMGALPPTLPADLSPGLAEIVKLAQSHVAEDTMVAFIENSGKLYNPTAEEVLYLNDLGLSDRVISALFKKREAVAGAPAAPALATADTALAAAPEGMMQTPPPPAIVDPVPLENPQDSYFYDDLAPYGSWVQVVDIGWCWQPMVSSVNTSWMPYRDRGRWLLTDEGWYWASDYTWGWAPFHYGRWTHDGKFGWVWSPGAVWAPAWVAWRDADTYSGWAPLPPNALFQPDIGLFAEEGLPGTDLGFGLDPFAFTFVAYEHFLSPHVSSFAATSSQVTSLYKGSSPVNNYHVKGRRLINPGVKPGRIAAVSKTLVRTYTLQDAKSPETSGGQTTGAAPGLAVFRPDLSARAVKSAASGVAQPVLINKGAREVADNSGQPAAVESAKSPARSTGFTSGNFQPSSKRLNSPADVSTPTGERPASWNSYEPNRPPRNPAPASAGAPVYSVAERRAPAYSPSPQVASENRGGAAPVYPNQAASAGPAPSSTTSASASRYPSGK